MFDHNSKFACHVNEHHRQIDFENVEVVGHEAHYHQRLFLKAWMSLKYPNAGNDHTVIPEVYKSLAHTYILPNHAHTARASFQFKSF